MNDEITSIIERVRECGYKVTQQRLSVIEVFVKNPKGLAAGGVHRIIPQISLATIYRTIDILVDTGILRRADMNLGDDGSLLYELNRVEKHHHYIICVKCGKTVEFDMCNFNELSQMLSEATNFEIYEHSLKVFGNCPKCK